MAQGANELTEALLQWVGSVLPDVRVSSQPLGSRETQTGVDVRLIRAAPRLMPRAIDRGRVIDLDFLLTIRHDAAAEEQHGVVELIFAAAARSDCEVMTDRDVGQLCALFGIGVAPGLVMRMSLDRQDAERPIRRVEHPLIVQTAGIGVIEGQVLGPGDVPVAGAWVGVAGLSPTGGVETDGHGRFRIAAAPEDAAGIPLVAQARGSGMTATVAARRPATLRLALES